MVGQYNLSEEQEMLRKTVERLAKEKIAPRAAEIDAKGEYPKDIFELFRQNEIIGIPFPSEYGGSGGGTLTYVVVIEEVAKVCGSSSVVLIDQDLGAMPILIAGNSEQKKKYISPIARGEIHASFALTEANAGSDVTGMQMKAVIDKDSYLVNGRKCFISSSNIADIICLFAKTDLNTQAKGISAFILDKKTRGLSIGKNEDKMGFRGIPICEVILEDVRIPKVNILGKEGEGFKIAMTTLNRTRPLVGAAGVGLAQGALNYAIQYAKERIQFGRPIATFQGLQFMMADMAMQIEAARQLIYRAAALIDENNTELGFVGAMAKCFATDVCMKVTVDAVQILGGYGYIKEYPTERMMRDAKLLQIVEGTNQIQRVIIARRLLR
jgi:alkylation response protein AidB-like acyl-CoA dehydrogenase